MDMEQNAIDQVFRNALHSQEQPPPPGSWDAIEATLNQSERKRVLVLRRMIAACVLVVVSLATGYFLGSYRNADRLAATPNTSQSSVLSEGNGAQPTAENLPPVITNKKGETILPNQPNTGINMSGNERNSQEDHENIRLLTEEQNKPDAELQKLEPLVANVNSEKLSGKALNFPSLEPLQEFSGEEIEIALDETPASGSKRWSVGGLASPLYAYRDLRGSSSSVMANSLQKSSITNLSKNEKPAFSYSSGMRINYKISDRIEIQSGIAYTATALSMTASFNSNVDAFTSIRNPDGAMMAIESETGDGIINSTGKIDLLTAYSNPTANGLKDIASPVSLTEAQLTQRLGYIEFPMLVRVRVTGSKIKLLAHGGLITNILTGNKVMYETNGKQINAGPTHDLSIMNYCGAFGLGTSIPLSSKWMVNVEPSFRYSINAISSTSDFSSHPYSFGVFTGLSYTF
jgi:hypothetical protein